VTARHLLVAASYGMVLMVATGCADPYARRPAADRETVSGELPAPSVSATKERLGRLPASPEAAARRAAELTTNWTAKTAADRYSELATFSVGPARRHAREAAARLPTDSQLDTTHSRGQVAAVIARDDGATKRVLLVVTHEIVDGDGLTHRRSRVTLSTVERRDGGWAVRRWEPQP
jgi:hypothetical protein